MRPCCERSFNSPAKLASEAVSTPRLSKSKGPLRYLNFKLRPFKGNSRTLLASCNVPIVAPFIELCSFDTRYKISGLACLDIHERLPTTERSWRSSPRSTRSECFLFDLMSIQIILLVLSVTSIHTSWPDLSNCLPQKRSLPDSRRPTSSFLRRRSMIVSPLPIDAHRKSSTWVVTTHTTFPPSR